MVNDNVINWVLWSNSSRLTSPKSLLLNLVYVTAVKLYYNKLGYNKLGYNDLGYNKLSCNKLPVITNKFFLSQIHVYNIMQRDNNKFRLYKNKFVPSFFLICEYDCNSFACCYLLVNVINLTLSQKDNIKRLLATLLKIFS
jgi:hypothetical protein